MTEKKPFLNWLRGRPTVFLEKPLLAKLKERRERKPITEKAETSCSTCDEIAGKVASKLPNPSDKAKVHEAIRNLTQPNGARDEAVETLESLGVLEETAAEIQKSLETIECPACTAESVCGGNVECIEFLAEASEKIETPEEFEKFIEEAKRKYGGKA